MHHVEPRDGKVQRRVAHRPEDADSITVAVERVQQQVTQPSSRAASHDPAPGGFASPRPRADQQANQDSHESQIDEKAMAHQIVVVAPERKGKIRRIGHEGERGERGYLFLSHPASGTTSAARDRPVRQCPTDVIESRLSQDGRPGSIDARSRCRTRSDQHRWRQTVPEILRANGGSSRRRLSLCRFRRTVCPWYRSAVGARSLRGRISSLSSGSITYGRRRLSGGSAAGHRRIADAERPAPAQHLLHLLVLDQDVLDVAAVLGLAHHPPIHGVGAFTGLEALVQLVLCLVRGDQLGPLLSVGFDLAHRNVAHLGFRRWRRRTGASGRADCEEPGENEHRPISAFRIAS